MKNVTKENAKHYLESYSIANLESKILEQNIAILKRKMELGKGVTYSDYDKVQGGKHMTADDQWAKILDMELQQQKRCNQANQLMVEIIDTIKLVKESALVNILLCKFIQGKSNSQTAKYLNYSYRWVTELTDRGIEEVRKILEKRD